jgi:hypothetical protein
MKFGVLLVSLSAVSSVCSFRLTNALRDGTKYPMVIPSNRFGGARENQQRTSTLVLQTAEDGVSLANLSPDFANDGKFLGDSITRWLDEEWIQQDIHGVIGDVVCELYIKSRENGVVDLGEMMMITGTKLESVDMGDAFVNAWDIANKVSDLLMLRLDRELCACMGDMSRFVVVPSVEEEILPFDSNPSTVAVRISARQKVYKPIPAVKVESQQLKRATANLAQEFDRYKFLRDFLEGEQNVENPLTCMNISIICIHIPMTTVDN